MHFEPLPLQPLYKIYKAKVPIAKKEWLKIISLPLFPDLKLSKVNFKSNIYCGNSIVDTIIFKETLLNNSILFTTFTAYPISLVAQNSDKIAKLVTGSQFPLIK